MFKTTYLSALGFGSAAGSTGSPFWWDVKTIRPDLVAYIEVITDLLSCDERNPPSGIKVNSVTAVVLSVMICANPPSDGDIRNRRWKNNKAKTCYWNNLNYNRNTASPFLY